MDRQKRSVLKDGVVVPPTGMELIVSDHCNITCRQCNHGAPILPKWNVEAADVTAQASVLSRHYRPAFVKFIGGEPLLHPKLAQVIEGVRSTGISDHYLLVTNGMLLGRMKDDIWSLIDEVEVSRYPGAGLTDEMLEVHKAKAEAFCVRFTLNDFPHFRRTFTRHRIEDDTLVRDIFRACKIANVWGCQGLYKGRLYRCPQSMYATTLADDPQEEGLPIADELGFTEALLEFLNGSEPLPSCRYCVGTAGRKQEHALLPRQNWADDLDEKAEDMIDRALLKRNLENVVTLDDCKDPANTRGGKLLRRVAKRIGIERKRMRRATTQRTPSTTQQPGTPPKDGRH